ncbi:MAG: hypothetical protein A3F54_05665 [Candidatus Kerfeldbacteria bacterium RIFCSPHIGHO2_12_FULL_48_17]|uniref:NAD-dependent epimerase/dehydratase domain-containing protein n=1 Tax=Candidatus Kerfeldbacteria bacterium RIFCSPHIGHO2_12_FULL_48_17 TaxID=1798542 RepID=A0A1G2B6F3_9BACT|nr:MAG: hypothetical protein A3F54_05665 [Candidatus Kerfeldbacteria bacterium RIFCSPHIGHO2_12_FULL_48_17]
MASQKKYPHILVTGSSGMIGTALCERLLAEGIPFTGVDYKHNLWNQEVDTHTLQVDLRDRKAVLKKLPAHIDMVIHLAANARVHDLVQDPSLAFDNLQTIFNTLEYAHRNDIKKFIFTSSREVYGNLIRDQYTEDSARIDTCESPYTASKIGGEALVQSYTRCYGIEHIIFRLSNVYGRYDATDRIVPLFIERLRANKNVTVYGADKVLDFTYIDDVVSGIMAGIDNFAAAKGQTLNLAYGSGITLTEFAATLKETLGSTSHINILPSRTGEVTHYVADIAKARQILNFTPTTNLEQGLRQAASWYQRRNADTATSTTKTIIQKMARALRLKHA